MKENKDEQKLFWDIEKLHPWDKNPRAIKEEEFEKLKKKIQKFGQFKPCIITPEGEVLGGNMRYRAYKALGIQKVWVSIVEPKSETEKLEISLADNEASGYYVQDDLAALISTTDIDRDLYTITTESTKTLADLMSMYEPEDHEATEQEYEEPPEVFIEIKTTKEVLLAIKATLDDWAEKYGAEYNIS